MSCDQKQTLLDRDTRVDTKKPVIEAVQHEISCKLQINPEQSLEQGVFIDFTVQNHSEDAVSVLMWYTPLEGFYSKLFIITDQNNQEIPYHGAMVKRLRPSAADYQLLDANDIVTTTLDLTLAYKLKSGEYQLQLNKKTLEVIANDKPVSSYQCRNEVITFSVNENLTR